MSDSVLGAIITAIGTILAATIPAYFIYKANNKKLATNEVSARQGIITILVPNDGEEIIVSSKETKPIDRPFSGKIMGFSKNEINSLGLKVEIFVRTDKWYRQGTTNVQNTGVWIFEHVKLGGTTHVVKALLKDKNGVERAKACEINVIIPRSKQPITKRVVSGGLHVRIRPGANEPILAKLNQGESVNTFNETVEIGTSVWVKISTDNVEGWVNAQYLR